MKHYLLACFYFVSLFCIGCSGTGNIPMTPLNPDDLSYSQAENSFTEGTAPLGLFNVWIDPVRLTGEITPLRAASLYDVLEVVDITHLLTDGWSDVCLLLGDIKLDSDGNLVVEFAVKHPVSYYIPWEPTRVDLHVFNVEGIIVSDGYGAPLEFDGIGQTVGNFTLANADGYTSYLDASLEHIIPTDATIHPYICHFDDYSQGNFNPSSQWGFESIAEPTGNLVMSENSDFDFQDYIFSSTGGGPLEFSLAIGCSYGVSAQKYNKRRSPEYRVPQFNKKAASEVKVEISSNDLYAGDISSTADLAIKVLDINHGVPVGPGIDQMFAYSSVAEIQVEVPGVTLIPVIIPDPLPEYGDGRDPDNPLLFEVQITNSAGASEGIYTGLVKVKDSYPVGANTYSYLTGKDGLGRIEFGYDLTPHLLQITEFATYQTFAVEVQQI